MKLRKQRQALRKATLTELRAPNPEGSKFFKVRGVRIRRGLLSKSGGVHILTVRKGPICANPEGYHFIKDLGKRKKD